MSWKIRKCIPARCFGKSTIRSSFYLLRHLLVAISLIWWFQSLVWTGFWILGHECLHRTFSPNTLLSDCIGLILHTFCWTPYFSHQISHNRHHSGRGHAEREELPASLEHEHTSYFEHTPIHDLWMLFLQQTVGYPSYILLNYTSQPTLPPGTSHVNRMHRFNAVVISDLAILIMAYLVYKSVRIFGVLAVIKYYGIPWIGLNHWLAMATYLQHTGPRLPWYRGKAWNLQRGALSTVDRPFLGWQGRFFLFNISHCHVAHHLFPQIPWYNLPEATEHLKEFLGPHYLYSDEPIFMSLWKIYNGCQFVDGEGDVVFYRNKKGETVEMLQTDTTHAYDGC
ncbi:hypothetical protein SISSUDRAFT_1069724 [Sistotremastrum suecicum HHB10207 ss-3]|uniref:Fatty acid desaturase domain-containing protein n=1 Tax=Sistotremastrum suecicum HHB10207 ss-3 TaxID=1314776 RepID=A0A166GG17_9AGAM|nr:hypothetical protein SISSUDRAFT_1069724 [Sistotremastrum suecicum HHB10207 ss-3]